MTVDTRLLTADELLEMPDDGFRYELVEGELQKMSPAGDEHGRIAARIAISLGAHVLAHHLGELRIADSGFLLARDPDTVRAPDVAFIRTERVVRTPKYFPGAPDVAIEVVSPSDRHVDVDTKTEEWLRYGTSAVVVVSPATRRVTVHRAKSITPMEDVLQVPDVVPGWKMPLAEIFEP